MRIALATVGTTGDIRPFVVLAGALAERDHDVTAVTWPVHGPAFARQRGFTRRVTPTRAGDSPLDREGAAVAVGGEHQAAVHAPERLATPVRLQVDDREPGVAGR